VACGDNSSTSEMLVCTKLTREVRQTIIDALVNNKVYNAEGPAGTGKTETCKDTMRMLCMEPIVYNCNENMTIADAETIIKEWRDGKERSDGK